MIRPEGINFSQVRIRWLRYIKKYSSIIGSFNTWLTRKKKNEMEWIEL